jgi:hypothetical protein
MNEQVHLPERKGVEVRKGVDQFPLVAGGGLI